MPCSRCRERDSCQGPCATLEAALESPFGTEDPMLLFFSEPRERLEDGDTFYMSRMPDRDARLLSLRDALRPLYELNDPRAAAVFLLRRYFEVSCKDLCNIFNLKERRVYDILRQVQGAVDVFQDGPDVSEPGGDN